VKKRGGGGVRSIENQTLKKGEKAIKILKNKKGEKDNK
jgi:hypothetical protein